MLDAWWASTPTDAPTHRPCAGAFETPDINSVDLKPIIDKKCHVNCHHAWEEYEKCEKRIEAKESGDCASWYMDYLKCIAAGSKWPSWQGHIGPPRSPQTAFEGLRLLTHSGGGAWQLRPPQEAMAFQPEAAQVDVFAAFDHPGIDTCASQVLFKGLH